MSKISLSNGSEKDPPFVVVIDKDKDFSTCMRLLIAAAKVYALLSKDRLQLHIGESSVINNENQQTPFTPNVVREEVHAEIMRLIPEHHAQKVISNLERSFPASDWKQYYPLQSACEAVLDAVAKPQ